MNVQWVILELFWLEEFVKTNTIGQLWKADIWEYKLNSTQKDTDFTWYIKEFDIQRVR